MAHWIYTVILAIAGLLQCSTGQSMQATFHMEGVAGQATMTWSAQTLTVTLNIQENLGQTTVEIHPIWVNYDAIDKCSDAVLGNTLDGATAQTTIVSGSPVSVSFSNVPSLTYYEGHSLVLRGNKVVCATIERDGDHVTARVRLRGSVFGDVYLRQPNDGGSSSTRIVSDLATQSDAKMGDWRITDNFPTCDEFMNKVLNSFHDPTSSASSGCSTSNQNACAIGDLTSKHGYINFTSSTDSSERAAYTDSNLPLYGDNSVRNLLMIVIPKNNKVKPACGKVNVYAERSAKATFSNDGVTGTIEFRQKSPLDSTITAVKLQGLAGVAGGYHVHMWPVPEREASSQGNMCAPERVSGHFNPFIAQVGSPGSPNYPAPEASTYDMYEVGDLSAKYGMLNGQQSMVNTYTDYNLQLFGRNSIVGRSLVIHRNDATSSRWVCVNIEPQYPVVAAQALFLYPVIGRVMFMQERGRPESDTSVFATLDYIDETPDTKDHKWMVGSTPLGDDMLEVDLKSRCVSAGSLYNPANLSPGLTNQVHASNKPVPFETGDLAGKLGLLSIGYSAASQ
ncbi:superoxide dismutase [Cu-Zn], partial [Elysia marginata]